MKKPAWTDKVERGMWLIVAQSATVFSAENGAPGMEREERDAVLAASRYADYHWAHHKTIFGGEDADVPAVQKFSKKRQSTRQQEARETESGGVPNTEGTVGRDQGLEESPSNLDVARA